MEIKTDWKFIVTAILTVVGIVVSLFIWRLDLSSHSIRVKTVSQTMLQPHGKNAISGLKVMIDNKPLSSPYLTVVEISNNGLKPILASSFEIPLEIIFEKNIDIARAQVTSTDPQGIEPVLTYQGNTLNIKPLLLNPNDKMTIAVVTSGAVPTFSVRTRIADITSADMVGSTTDQNKFGSKKSWIAAVFALGLLMTYVLIIPVGRRQVKINTRTRWVIATTSVASSVLIMNPYISPNLSFWTFTFIFTPALAVASIIGFILNRNPINEPTSKE